MHIKSLRFQILCQTVAFCGATVLVGSSFAAGSSARAEPVAAVPVYAVTMVFEASGEKSTPRVIAKAGEQFALASGEWRMEMTVRQGTTPAEVSMSAKVFKGMRLVSTPTMTAHINEKATIKVGDTNEAFSLSMVVSPQP